MEIKNFNLLKKNLKKDVSEFRQLKIAVLGDSSTQLLCQAIKGYAVEYSYDYHIFEADYNQIELQVFETSSELYRFSPDHIILYFSTRKLIKKFYSCDRKGKEQFAENVIDLFREIYNTLSFNLKSKLLFFNFTEINDAVYGNYSNKIKNSFIYQLRKINFELMNLSNEFNDFFIIDLSSVQNLYGKNYLFDNKIYINTEILLSIDILPVVAQNICDIISSINGIVRKCIILDLDNTIWGGVIGDDGIEKIQTGELGIGKAFTDLQLWLKQLKERGVLLAVCSKNDEIIAKGPFENHPDMVLRLEDFSVFVANWENKVNNIRYIQGILNIGFDSMVFLDDNPFERNFVKSSIPEITVPDLPEDPALYLDYLCSLNLFETASVSEEDEVRTKQYQEEAKRKISMTFYTDEKGFLESLGMISSASPFNNFNIPRVAQLIQRSNQFNLRTARYSESELASMSGSDKYKTFAFTLSDKFGNNGLISVIILSEQLEDLFIDTWIMSCRVLKRGMENFVLNYLVRFAQKNGFKRITGEYIPTQKNGMVKNHYHNLGFKENNKYWVLETGNYIFKENYIKEI